ncbi:hypothetical protein NSPZN2_40717 [Nitrospira defluvii]|uniref:Transposase n=1 Tax=Nitrospira defluvii TaxID=330214 RepID=A0ABM8RZR3_9BACT|nr:hypothetical protein NSPZN2_40717 [Nitrospira defluvii]
MVVSVTRHGGCGDQTTPLLCMTATDRDQTCLGQVVNEVFSVAAAMMAKPNQPDAERRTTFVRHGCRALYRPRHRRSIRCRRQRAASIDIAQIRSL